MFWGGFWIWGKSWVIGLSLGGCGFICVWGVWCRVWMGMVLVVRCGWRFWFLNDRW